MSADVFDPDGPASDESGIFGLPHSVDDAGLVVIPVPFEATTSYGRGTARAPARVLEASRQVDLNDAQTGDPWKKGIAMLPIDPAVERWNDEASAKAIPIVQAGGAATPELQRNLTRVNEIGDALNEWVYTQTKRVIQRGAVAGVLGGDHAVSFGAIRAAAERWPGLGILHVDAHADLREAYEGFTWSHASILYNVHERLQGLGHTVQVGIRDFGRAEAERIERWGDITTFTDHELGWELASGEPWTRICARIVRPLPEKVWVTFDVDGLDPSLCPRTGTPVPGGLSWRDALLLLQHLGENRTVVGFDLVEVGDGEWDANVGARLLYKLAGWSLKRPPLKWAQALLATGALLLGSVAEAAPSKGKKGGGPKKKKKEPVEVPIDIGVGPAAHFVTGPIFREQTFTTGLAISAEAVLDNKTIRKLKSRIPAQYRQQALELDEVRISHPLIPRTLFLSPAGVAGSTVGMYGILFRPIAVGLPLIKDPFRLDLDLGVVLTYAYVHSTEIPSPTHFLRPGLDPKLEIEVPFSDTFLVSLGWQSQVYIPQPVGGGIFEIGPLDEAMWHVGQAFLKFHVRFPYEVDP